MIFALSNVPWTAIILDVFVSVWNRNGFAILKGRCAIWRTIIQRVSLFELRAGLANYVWCNLSLLWTVLSFSNLYSLFKRKRPGKKSRFFLELNEMPNKNGRFATGFVRHFSILMHGRRLGQMQCCSINSANLSVRFTAKLFWVISIIASDCHAYEKTGLY